VVDRTFFLETTSIQDGNLDPSKIDDNELAFQIIGVGKSFTVYADSVDHKREWMTILEETISMHKANHLQARGTLIEDESAAVWIPDSAVKECMICSKEFNLITRKHHCRRCGGIVCAECSKNKAIVPGVDKYKEVRICSRCKDIS